MWQQKPDKCAILSLEMLVILCYVSTLDFSEFFFMTHEGIVNFGGEDGGDNTLLKTVCLLVLSDDTDHAPSRVTLVG